MPAFRFKRRFVPLIQAGAKTHTIRATRARGLTMEAWAPLYTGTRMKPELIGSGRMNRVQEVRLDFDARSVEVDGRVPLAHWGDLLAFAISDGFESWEDMEQFWADNHPGVRQFTGVLMGWGEFTTDHRIGGSHTPARSSAMQKAES